MRLIVLFFAPFSQLAYGHVHLQTLAVLANLQLEWPPRVKAVTVSTRGLERWSPAATVATR